jgi:hypothetical protein
MSPYWYIWGCIILGVGLLGWWKMLSTKKEISLRLGLMLGIISVVAFIFGLGISTPWSRPIIEWAYEYLPLFRGYRETQKWIGLFMILEGISFIIGSAVLLRWFRDRFFSFLAFFLILLSIFLWSPGMIFGFRGQLITMNYQESFSLLRTSLLEMNPQAKILLLPWHSYMACSWTNARIIANPLPTFFSPLRMIGADNIEARSVLYSNSTNPESRAIETFLSASGHIFTPLSERGFTHILITKDCGMKQDFAWMDEIPECNKE